jgi:hypothetical protein
MKKVLLLAVLIGIIVSCSKDCDTCDDGLVISKWILIEQLVDPGDGSGEFIPIESDKIIEFLDNARVISNGSLCTMSVSSGETSTGSTIAPQNYIIPDNCVADGIQLYYEQEFDTLIIFYPCIEACAHKYIRLLNN